MKIRMRISIAGHAMPHYGITGTYSLAPGDELEIHDELAEKWCASGHAEAVVPDPAETKKAGRKGKRTEPSLELEEQESE